MFLKKLTEAVSSDQGTVSSLRIVFVLFAFAFAVSYIYVAVTTQTIPTLPESVLGTIVSLLIAKVAQKKVEKQEENDNAQF